MDNDDRNPSVLLATLGVQGPMSRTDLAKAMSVSPATMTQLARRLIELGAVRELDSAPSTGGRPAKLLALANGRAGAIGVKISPTRVTVVNVMLDGSVEQATVTDLDPSHPDALDTLGDLISAQVQAFDGILLGVGIGVPGAVDDQAVGTVDAPTIGWHRIALGEYLRRRLPAPVPVLVDNDINTLAVAEHLYGEGGRHPSPLIVTIGHGIGCAVVSHGRLLRGHRGGAGEIGHVPIVADGPRCRCGNHGCLEAVVGDDGLAALARQRGVIGKDEGKQDLNRRALDGEAEALQIFTEAGATLGLALAGVAQIADPDVIVLLGEGTDVWELWQPSFTSTFRRHLLPDRRSLPVVVEEWSDDRWAGGAACLVLFSPFDTTGLSGDQGQLVRERLQRGMAPAGAR